MRIKHWFAIIGKITVSSLLLWWALLKIDIVTIFSYLDLIDWKDLIVPVLVLIVLAIIQAWRWSLVVGVLKGSLSVSKSIHLTMLSLFFNQVFPSTIGGDGVKIWQLYKSGTLLKSATIGVLSDRLLALLTLVIMSLIALLIIYIVYGDILIFRTMLLTVLGGLLGFMLFFQLYRLPDTILSLKFVASILSIVKSFKLLMNERRVAFLLFFSSFFVHIGLAILVFYIGQLVDSQIDLASCLLIFPSVFLISSIPVSISGWGVRESAMIIGFSSIGVDANSALLVSVIFGVCMLIQGLIGGVWWILVKNEV